MISILCPTRKRPQNMERLHRSLADTSLYPLQIELIFYIDTDDKESIEVASKLEKIEKTIKTRFAVGPRILLSQTWNKCYHRSTGDILGFICDEAVFRTQSWDKTVSDAICSYSDRIVLIYGKDGIQDHRDFGAYLFVHRNWPETIGYLAPPYFSCDFNDSWLNEVARRINRHKRVDMVIEHMHFSKGKATKDETHKERIRRGKFDNVRAQYNALSYKRKEDAEKLRKFIDDYSSSYQSDR